MPLSTIIYPVLYAFVYNIFFDVGSLQILICQEKSWFVHVINNRHFHSQKCCSLDNKLYHYPSPMFLLPIICVHRIQITWNFTIYIFQAKDASMTHMVFFHSMSNPMICTLLFSFLTNSTLISASFGKNLLCAARPRCGTLGKIVQCLFCGDWQQSSLERLKAKWKIPHE